MPIKGKKNLPIDEDTHRLIAQASLDTGRDMYELISEAWEYYETSIRGRQTQPYQSTGLSKKAGNLLLTVIENQEGRRWLRMLAYILRGGSAQIINGIKINLQAIASLCQEQRHENFDLNADVYPVEEDLREGNRDSRHADPKPQLHTEAARKRNPPPAKKRGHPDASA